MRVALGLLRMVFAGLSIGLSVGLFLAVWL